MATAACAALLALANPVNAGANDPGRLRPQRTPKRAAIEDRSTFRLGRMPVPSYRSGSRRSRSYKPRSNIHRACS